MRFQVKFNHVNSRDVNSRECASCVHWCDEANTKVDCMKDAEVSYRPYLK